MKTKKSKYDTNPLDPDFVKKTEEVWGEAGSGPETKEVKGATREIGSAPNENARRNVYSEAPTRRYDNVNPESPYPSVFVPPTYSPPAPYQPSPTPYRSIDQKPTHRSVAGIGLPEKWAEMLPTLRSTLVSLFRCSSCFWCPGENHGCVFTPLKVLHYILLSWSCPLCLVWLEQSPAARLEAPSLRLWPPCF